MKSLLETQLPGWNFVAPLVQQASTDHATAASKKLCLHRFRRTVSIHSSKNVD